MNSSSPDANTSSSQAPAIFAANFDQHLERALVPGTPALVEELARRLALEETFDNPRLNRIAESCLQGTRGMGTFTPRDVYDAMETAVNIYLLNSGLAREGLLTDDPRAFLTNVLKPLVKRLPRQTDRTQEHIELQQFSTPPTIAYLAARALSPRPEDIALEPSAGTASLALWLRAASCAEVLTNEIAPRRCALLELAGFSPTTYDGEYIHDLMPRELRPTAILTNPPFSATGGRVKAHRSIYGANHLASDLRRLEPGGRLAGISTGYMAINRPGFAAWWRQIINRYNVRANLTLPGGEYSKYGTHFETQLIVIDKTGPTPGDSLREQLRQIVWGTCASVEEAMDRVAEIAATRPDPQSFAQTTATDAQEEIIVLSEPDPETEQEAAPEAEVEEERPTNRFDALEMLPSTEAAAAPTEEETGTPAEDDGAADQAKLKPAQDEPAAPVYVSYVTRKLIGGREHPADLVEAATMACVDPPDIHYRPHLQPAIITEGRLSRVQLERVIYAGQRHEQRLFNGARAGFFNGDGTGAGKGRSNSGIILDNWNQGRRRSVWLSVSQGLIEDARRDLNDLGVSIPLAQINEYGSNGEITLREGVIFCTYSSLIAKSKQGKTRLAQLRRWLDGDSVIIIDECVPAGTMISTPDGERPIEDLKPDDLVLGVNHETGEIEATPVRHLFRSETSEPLHQIHDTPLTGNHPVWTSERGYMRADQLTPLETVALLERKSTDAREDLHLRMVQAFLHAEVQAEQEAQGRKAPLLQHVMLREMAHEPAGLRQVADHRRGAGALPREPPQNPQPPRSPAENRATPALHLEPLLLAGNTRQIAQDTEGAGLLAPDGRQRHGTDRPATKTQGTAHMARRGTFRDSETQAARLPGTLLSRFSGAGTEARHRDRRHLSPHEKAEGTGRTQGSLSPGKGLDDHQVPQRRDSDGHRTGGLTGSQSRTVYNIETGTGNYFANRLLVHNCHKAKNALNTGKGAPTQTGQAVIDLQDPEVSPDYRIVYSSATGATDVRNMAYMTRLGLWGLGTSFATFEEFLSQIEEGGIGAMELVCRDMKALGMYLSASISYEGVEYTETKHMLTPRQREMYNAAAAAWLGVLTNFNGALECTGAGSRQRGRAMQGFWSRHQRFFRLLISAFKVPTVIRQAEAALAADRSVIISLIGTGEARTKDQVQEALAHGGLIEDLDFSPLEIIVEAVNSCFPTVVYEDETDEQTGKTTQVPVERDGQIVHSQEALDLKQQTLDNLQVLDLPENPLDQLVNHWGASQVAEITGRKRRLVRNERTGAIEYKKRAPEGIAMKRVNLFERQQYQEGKKRVAIISKAASTGISLHADNRAQNRQQREFLTLELSWSADEQIQMFGRGHRTDQAHPPRYNLISTELGGEVRFSSTIARRLGSLGALTKGDRGAVDNELAKYNFETIYGKAALQLLFRRIVCAEVNDDGEIVEQVQVPGLLDPRQTLKDMGLLVTNGDGIEEVRSQDNDNIPRFLNRVLALDVDRQNSIFNYFSTLFDEVVAHAKSTGTFDEGVQDIRAVRIRVAKQPTVVHTDQTTGASTSHFTLEIEVPTDIVPFDELLERLSGRDYAFYEHKETGNYMACTPSSRHTDPNGNSHRFYAVTRPNGWRMDYMAEEMLFDKYRVCQRERAREWWQMMVALLPDTEKYTQHIISGAIISLWERIQSKDGDPLQVVRVTTDDGARIVGLAIHASRITKVLDLLGVHHDLSSTPEIFRGVLDEGARIELLGEMALKRSSVNSENRIELVGAHPFRFRELRTMGLINETIKHRQRFFVPTVEDTGCDILTRLFERYPPLDQKQKAEEAEAPAEDAGEALMLSAASNVFDLTELADSPEEIVASNATSRTDDSLFATIERTPAEPIVFVEQSQSQSQTAPVEAPDADAVTNSVAQAPAGSLFPEAAPPEVVTTTEELGEALEQLRIEEEQAQTTEVIFVQTNHGPAITRAQITVSEKKVRRRKSRVPENQMGFQFLLESQTPNGGLAAH